MKNNIIPFFNHKALHDPIQEELAASFKKVLKGNQLMLGEEVQSFENNVCSLLGVKYAIGVNSGLDALVISLRACGIGQGDEVIVPSNTYVATWLAVSMVGATPIGVEPSIIDYNINVDLIEQSISSKTKAIIPVHLYGLPCQMEKLLEIKSKYNIFIIEDNAQAFGAFYQNQGTGSFGDINASSFYPTKNLGAIGDAGMITTNNQNLYEQCIMLRNYGSKEKYINEVFGYNSRLDEVQAAILNVKLKYLDFNINQKKEIASWYNEKLSSIVDIIKPVCSVSHTYHQYVIRCNYRELLQNHLNEKGISTLIHYPCPPHKQPIYKEQFKHFQYPIADELAQTSLSLPSYVGISEEDVKLVCEEICLFYKKL